MRFFFALMIGLASLLAGCGSDIDSADDLISAHMAALGGHEAWQAIHTISSIGTYKEAAFEQVHRFDQSRPNFIRITTNYDEATGDFGYCEGFDGGAWEYSFKIPVRVIGEPARALKNASQFEPSYIDYRRKGFQARFRGRTQIKEEEVYHLQIIRERGAVDNFFFDVESLMSSIDLGRAPFHGEGAIIEIFEKRSEYRPVAGVMMPHKIEQISGEDTLARLTWQKIEVNQTLPENWFSPPLSAEQKQFKRFRSDILAGDLQDWRGNYDGYQKTALGNLHQRLENELNTFGYELISHKRYADAIQIFQLALSKYPGSANLYDSLGEAYLLHQDTLNAVKNYRRSIELDGDNQHAVDILSQIAASQN